MSSLVWPVLSLLPQQPAGVVLEPLVVPLREVKKVLALRILLAGLLAQLRGRRLQLPDLASSQVGAARTSGLQNAIILLIIGNTFILQKDMLGQNVPWDLDLTCVLVTVPLLGGQLPHALLQVPGLGGDVGVLT